MRKEQRHVVDRDGRESGDVRERIDVADGWKERMRHEQGPEGMGLGGYDGGYT